MRLIILALFLMALLLLIGCTEQPHAAYDGVVQALRETRMELSACQNSLNSGSREAVSEVPSQPEAPSEPQYRYITVFHVDVGGKTVKCLTRDDGNEDSPACGTKFSECDGDYVYRCLQNVKYKTTEEKQLVKSEE